MHQRGYASDRRKGQTMAHFEDLPEFRIGHDTVTQGATGCTVIVAPNGAVGGVDVRGGAPATRETDLLRPENLVESIHAVVLSGGSAFGLAAGSGVAAGLEERGIGLDAAGACVPIVCQASLFDLAVGSNKVRPDSESGRRAVCDALSEDASGATRHIPQHNIPQGNVGAGTGASVGKIRGNATAMKTGLGVGMCNAGPLHVGAVVALNAVGDVIDPHTGQFLAGLRDEHQPDAPSSTIQTILADAQRNAMPLDRTNTTIACIVTNASLTKAQATKVAQMAHDAYAHCIRPTHTTNDGDTIFVMASGATHATVDSVGVAAVSALEKAIVNAAVCAQSAYGLPASRDLRPR